MKLTSGISSRLISGLSLLALVIATPTLAQQSGSIADPSIFTSPELRASIDTALATLARGTEDGDINALVEGTTILEGVIEGLDGEAEPMAAWMVAGWYAEALYEIALLNRTPEVIDRAILATEFMFESTQTLLDEAIVRAQETPDPEGVQRLQVMAVTLTGRLGRLFAELSRSTPTPEFIESSIVYLDFFLANVGEAMDDATRSEFEAQRAYVRLLKARSTRAIPDYSVALEAYEQVVAETSPEVSLERWVDARYGLGIALAELGEMTDESSLVRRSITELGVALEHLQTNDLAYGRERLMLHIAFAFYALGEIELNPSHLVTSVAQFDSLTSDEALLQALVAWLPELYQRRGYALSLLGYLTGEPAPLRLALLDLDLAIEGFAARNEPLWVANTLVQRGIALSRIWAMTFDEEMAVGAILTFDELSAEEAILAELEHPENVHYWGGTTRITLGFARMDPALSVSGIEELDLAIAIGDESDFILGGLRARFDIARARTFSGYAEGNLAAIAIGLAALAALAEVEAVRGDPPFSRGVAFERALGFARRAHLTGDTTDAVRAMTTMSELAILDPEEVPFGERYAINVAGNAIQQLLSVMPDADEAGVGENEAQEACPNDLRLDVGGHRFPALAITPEFLVDLTIDVQGRPETEGEEEPEELRDHRFPCAA